MLHLQECFRRETGKDVPERMGVRIGGRHMTDEEARRVVRQTLQVDEDYGDMSVEIMLVKAGYRQGLEEVSAKLQEHS